RTPGTARRQRDSEKTQRSRHRRRVRAIAVEGGKLTSMLSRTRLSTFCIFTSIAVILLQSCRPVQEKRPPYALPNESAIQRMHAAVSAQWLGFPDIPEFEVPQEEFDEILYWLHPAEHIPDPLHVDNPPFGELTLVLDSGEIARFTIYWTGKNGLLFTPDGEFFYGGRETNDGKFVDGAINLMHAIEAARDGTEIER
ncbi:MAG: hypothetical protein ACREJB_19330, partial [Planctomycetaceae bacterium]